MGKTVQRAAILGGGVIGGGWLARLIENGVECRVFDPDQAAERKLGEVLAGADRAFGKLTIAPRLEKAAWSLVGPKCVNSQAMSPPQRCLSSNHCNPDFSSRSVM